MRQLKKKKEWCPGPNLMLPVISTFWSGSVALPLKISPAEPLQLGRPFAGMLVNARVTSMLARYLMTRQVVTNK